MSKSAYVGRQNRTDWARRTQNTYHAICPFSHAVNHRRAPLFLREGPWCKDTGRNLSSAHQQCILLDIANITSLFEVFIVLAYFTYDALRMRPNSLEYR